MTDCFEHADAIMADEEVVSLEAMAPREMRLGALRSLVLDDLDPPVARDFERALTRLAESGVRIDDVSFEAVKRFPALNAKVGSVPPTPMPIMRR